MAEPKRALQKPIYALGKKFVIIEARYYDEIGAMLLAGARAALQEAGAVCDVINVPGALEIPCAAAIAMTDETKDYVGVIALGCVIRGETFHFDIVAGESSRGLMDLSAANQWPVGNGILTVENEEQAIERADPARGNKGADAARAALSLYDLLQRVRVSHGTR